MEKNRIHPVHSGKNMRMSFSRQNDVLEMPNLIEVQKSSYEWFLTEGLREVFEDISPIGENFSQLSLEFGDFRLCRDEIKYTIEECKERDATYAAPLKVVVRLYNKQNGEIKDHEIFMGDLPLMTDTGSFVINGAERCRVCWWVAMNSRPNPRRSQKVDQLKHRNRRSLKSPFLSTTR